jgi:DNA-binding NarL/FixJ family response regulator
MVRASRSVLVVAAEPLLRCGLAALLERAFAVVDAVGTVNDGVRAITRHMPKLCVLVLAPPLPDASVEQTCSHLVGGHPETSTVALFRLGDYRHIAAACRYGARGFFDTSVQADDLQSALEQVYLGEVAVHPALLSHIVDAQQWNGKETSPDALLTDSQLRSLTLLADGYSSKEIARITGMSTTAVNHSIERATQRLGASHRTHAVARAFHLGLLSH